jgi:hypothetical protein
MRIAILILLVICLIPMGSLAAEQYAGTVEKVDVAVSKLTVKKADGNRFTFVVNPKTVFTGSRKAFTDLGKGDPVTVEFQNEGGQYLALKVTTP